MSPKCNFKISGLLLRPPASLLAGFIPVERFVVLAMKSGLGLMRGPRAFVGLVVVLLLSACSFVHGDTMRPSYYELRIYTVASNKLDAVLERFRETVEPVRRRHGIKTVGYWTVATTNGDKFVCLLAGESIPAISKSMESFLKDDEWIRVEKKTEVTGKLRSGVTAYMLIPTEFSNLK